MVLLDPAVRCRSVSQLSTKIRTYVHTYFMIAQTAFQPYWKVVRISSLPRVQADTNIVTDGHINFHIKTHIIILSPMVRHTFVYKHNTTDTKSLMQTFIYKHIQYNSYCHLERAQTRIQWHYHRDTYSDIYKKTQLQTGIYRHKLSDIMTKGEGVRGSKFTAADIEHRP